MRAFPIVHIVDPSDRRDVLLSVTLIDPARELALDKAGKSKGLPVRITKTEVRLHRDWRWRLISAGCDAAYPFPTIGESDSPWRSL